MTKRVVAGGLCVVVLGVCLGLLVHSPEWTERIGWLRLMAAAWVLFAIGLWLVLKMPQRAAVVLIVLGGITLPLVAATDVPRSSDDLYRYLWDGKVQSAGIDPYRYAPADTVLHGLRDDFLWPTESAWCVPPGAVDPQNGQSLTAGCSRINRPQVRTIYPPVAQVYFAAVHLTSPAGGQQRPLQLWAALFAFATTCLLLWALSRLGLDRRWAAVWAWCPLVAFEAVNNAHVDVIAAFGSAIALYLLARGTTGRRVFAGGVVLGLAIAVKLTPALLGPALVRRRPFALVGGVLSALAIVYLPHVLAVGPAVLGYIPGYLTEEGYQSGGRFGLINGYVPHELAPIVAVSLLAVIAALVIWQSDPDRPWDGALVMTGSALLVTTPQYPWYALLLVMLVAYAQRPEWLTIGFAGYVAQHANDLELPAADAELYSYGAAALIVGAVWLARHVNQMSTAGAAQT